MGRVFRARDEKLQREVALKFLFPRPGFEQQTLEEARSVARLDQENIVRIFDVAEWSRAPGAARVPFLVMECLEGESLAALLKREHLGVRRALEILRAITTGLAHAHARHIVHRDLKPGNVFLTRQGTVKLVDFGLSHLASGPASSTRQPTWGTPGYMAPEQWRGEAQDARTDLWAAGVVLYEMLTGRLPFTGFTREELRAQVTSAAPVPSVRAHHPEIPPEVEVLLATALAKAPTRRFASALELREEVRELEARLGPEAVEETPVLPQRRRMTLIACRLRVPQGAEARLDSEDLGELQAAFHQACGEVIQQHGGSLLPFVGSGVLACFGHPQAREDDPERAVHAGLHLVDSLPELLRRKLPRLPVVLAVSVGIHTDEVVLREGALAPWSQGPLLQGDAPNLTEWLAREAGPGEVVVGATAWRRVHGAFETALLGARTFEGGLGSKGLELHRVLRERKAASRFEQALAVGGLTPLVGRQRELGWLLERWEQACQERGALVLVSGEAGIGKSRLIQELCEQVPPGVGLLLRTQCWSRFSTRALHPMVAVLQGTLHSTLKEPPSRWIRELEARREEFGLSSEEVHLVGLLLELPIPTDSPVLQLTPERRKEKSLALLVQFLMLLTRCSCPVLLVVEDVHWADSILLEWLGLLIEHVERGRCLVVLSARPEFRPDWPPRHGFHRLALERLPEGLAAVLVKQSARGRELPEETVQQLVAKTDGIPLFIEEMTRMVLEGGEAASIPVTLHELLLARLDLLPSRQKALAQLCAVVGRDFSWALLVTLSERKDAGLRRELAGLVEAGLLQAREGPEGPGFQFRHALLQDAAYQSLPRGLRRQHHQRITQVLVERFPEVVAARPEVLAHHSKEAGAYEAAIRYGTRAGVLALQRWALREAVGHLSRALDLLRGLPDASQHAQEELRILTALRMPLVALQSYRSLEVERLFTRMCELLPGVEESLPQLKQSYGGAISYFYIRGQFPQAYALAMELLRLGERHQDPETLSLAHRFMAANLLTRGRLREAREHGDRAVELASSFAELRLSAHGLEGFLHATLGEPEVARRHCQEALDLAHRIGPSSYITLSSLTHYVAGAYQLLRQSEGLLELLTQAKTLGSARFFWLLQTWSMGLQGWVMAELGKPREGLALVLRALEALRVQGIEIARLRFMGLLAELHLTLGEVEAGLAVVREALDLVERTGERFYEAELHRVDGELLWAAGSADEARSRFLRALQVAREQGAGLFELRAMVSLCRLLGHLGRPAVARRLLGRACARFETGGDSRDLREARALLALAPLASLPGNPRELKVLKDSGDPAFDA
jgi:predicted ATPase/class 3 adenylate cyclase